MGAGEDIELIVEHNLTVAIDSGHPPRQMDSWIASVKAELHRQEARRPGHIARVAQGIRARQNGRRVTGWREERGTHGISYTPDKEGTDRPPWL